MNTIRFAGLTAFINPPGFSKDFSRILGEPQKLLWRDIKTAQDFSVTFYKPTKRGLKRIKRIKNESISISFHLSLLVVKWLNMCLTFLGIKSCNSHNGSLMPSYVHRIVQREMWEMWNKCEVLLKRIYRCTNKLLRSHIFAFVAVVVDIGQHPVGCICDWKGGVVSIGA